MSQLVVSTVHTKVSPPLHERDLLSCLLSRRLLTEHEKTTTASCFCCCVRIQLTKLSDSLINIPPPPPSAMNKCVCDLCLGSIETFTGDRNQSLGQQDLHDGADSSTVTFPHASEPRLTADIPQLQNTNTMKLDTHAHCLLHLGIRTTHLDGDVPFSDLPHVESNCRNHVFTELARLKQTNTQIHTQAHTHTLFSDVRFMK